MATQPTAIVVGNRRFYDMFKASADARFFGDIRFVQTVVGLQDVEVDSGVPTCYLFSVRVEDDLAEQGYENITVAEVIGSVPDPDEDVFGLVIHDSRELSEQLAEQSGIKLLTPKRAVSAQVYETCGLGEPVEEKVVEELPKPVKAFKPKKKTPPRQTPKPAVEEQTEEEIPAVIVPPKKKTAPAAPKGPIQLPELDDEEETPAVRPTPAVKRSPKPIELPDLEEEKPAPEPVRRPRPIALANEATKQRRAEEESRNAIVSRPRSNWGQAKKELRESADKVTAPVSGSNAWREGKRNMRGVVNAKSRRRWGTVIVMSARKGGVGKTTLAVNLAEFLGQYAPEGRKVCLVDMNSQQGDVSYYMGKDSPNIYSLVTQNYLLEDADRFSRIMVKSPSGNFDALLAPKNSLESGPDKVNANLYSQAIDLLSDMYDIVVVDTPVGERWHAGMEFILKRANFILTPVTSSRTTVLGVKSWLDDITQPESVEEGLGISSAHIGVILNRGRANVGMDANEVKSILTGYKVLAAIPDSPDWQFAENEGRILAENLPDGLLALFSYVAYHATSASSYSDVAKKEAYKRSKANGGAPSAGSKQKSSGGFGSMLKSWFKVG